MFFLLVTALGAVQEDLVDVDRLHSPDIRIREAAERRLADHGPEWIPLLRRRSAIEIDAEVKARLGAAADVILSRETGHLLREGSVDAALRMLSGDEEDLEAFISGNKQAVEAEIRGWYPQADERSDCTIDNATAAEQIRERFGIWGIAVLLDGLGREDKAIPASGILAEMNDDVVPCLSRALRGGSPTFRREACTVLYVRVCVNGRPIEEGSGLSEALRSVEEDLGSDSETRFYARSLLNLIVGAVAEGD